MCHVIEPRENQSDSCAWGKANKPKVKFISEIEGKDIMETHTHTLVHTTTHTASHISRSAIKINDLLVVSTN